MKVKVDPHVSGDVTWKATELEGVSVRRRVLEYSAMQGRCRTQPYKDGFYFFAAVAAYGSS